eukprot:Platyproteum_vivax@DN2048_c0_g1_i1.p1
MAPKTKGSPKKEPVSKGPTKEEEKLLGKNPNVQLQELREIRMAFDFLSGSEGSIAPSSLQKGCQDIGYRTDAGLISQAKPDEETEEIAFEAFYDMMTSKVTKNESRGEVDEIFKLFDKKSAKIIDPRALKELALELNEPIDPISLQEMSEVLDADGDGKISPDDFYNCLMASDEATKARARQRTQKKAAPKAVAKAASLRPGLSATPAATKSLDVARSGSQVSMMSGVARVAPSASRGSVSGAKAGLNVRAPVAKANALKTSVIKPK